MANPSDPPAMTPALFDRPSLESRLAEADADWGSADWPAECYSGDTRADLRSCLAEIDRLTKENEVMRSALNKHFNHGGDFCFECSMPNYHDHEPDCQLGALFGRKG